MLRRSPLASQSPRTVEQRGQREAFAEKVMRRDRWRCVAVWPEVEHRGKLDPHHIEPVSRAPQRRFDVTNGITLCRAHHDAAHGHPALARERGLIA